MKLIRGVLLAGRFRTHHSLNAMSADDQRNTLIVEMAGHSNRKVEHYQSLADDDLAGVGAVMVFLRAARIRTDAELRRMSPDDQRNTLIVELADPVETVAHLQAMSNVDLVLSGLGRTPAGGLSQSSYLRGALLAGQFRTHRELLAMSPDDQRNTLIAELAAHSSRPLGVLQGMNDFDLAGAGAAMVFLQGAGIRDDAALRTMSLDDQRNTLIVEIDGQTHLGSRLQGLRTLDLVLAGLGVDPVFPAVPRRPYRFSIESLDVRVHKSDGDHSDSDWLTVVVSIGNAATKEQPRVLPPQTFHVGDAIRSGDRVAGPFKSDLFDAEETDVVFISYVLTNLGSSRLEDQSRQAVEVTNKVVGIAAPIVGTAVGLFLGQPGEGFKIGQQVAKTFDEGIDALGEVLDFLGLHFAPPNCNGVVLSDTLTFGPGELAQAAGLPSSRQYTGAQENERCGSAPETTVGFIVRRLPGDGLISPDF